MFYRFSITTDENTSEVNKIKTILPVAKGIVHQVDIVFPSGCAGLLHLHINGVLHQVWPTNDGQSFAADNVTISFREFINVFDPPYQFHAYTWNEDDTWSHTVIIRFGILPSYIIAPWLLTYEERIKAILGQ